MEKLQQVSPYTPYTYLAVKDGVYTLFTIIPIYKGQKLGVPNSTIDSKHNYQEVTIRVSGVPTGEKRLILEFFKVVLDATAPIDMAEIKEPEEGEGVTDDTDNTVNPINLVKLQITVQENNLINRQALLTIEDADEQSDATSLTAYNCPYSYVFKKEEVKQACLKVIVPLQGYKYHPSLEETIVNKKTNRVGKIITLIKDPIYGDVYGGVAISPTVTYQYENRISIDDFFEVKVDLFNQNISYAKSKPRTMNPDEL